MFHRPTFDTVHDGGGGLSAQPVSRTVCEMLTGPDWPDYGTTAEPTGSSPPPAGTPGMPD
jgi:hypothetical protein